MRAQVLPLTSQLGKGKVPSGGGLPPCVFTCTCVYVLQCMYVCSSVRKGKASSGHPVYVRVRVCMYYSVCMYVYVRVCGHQQRMPHCVCLCVYVRVKEKVSAL